MMKSADPGMKNTNHYFPKSRPKEVDDFLPTLEEIFTIAKYFGIPTYGGKVALCWAVTILGTMIALEIGAIWKLSRLLAGVATNTRDGRGFIARLSGSIFYANGVCSLILSWRLISSWKAVTSEWVRSEKLDALNLPPDENIRKRVLFVSSFVATFAILEHIMSMVSATGFNIPPEEYFHRYILSSHGFLLQNHDYTLWLAVPIFILSKIATLFWNYQDLLIILISMGLTSRYHRLNRYVSALVKVEKKASLFKKSEVEKYAQIRIWRQIREAYVRQAALVRRVDSSIGILVLLSNMNNFYFICLQLFLGINKSHGDLINTLYYFFSLGWLLFRACSVVLAAADVNLHSKRALKDLYGCPAIAYNVEVKRLKNQLSNDVVCLSGMGFFVLDRQLLLEVAAAILKYELVLIQYDK